MHRVDTKRRKERQGTPHETVEYRHKQLHVSARDGCGKGQENAEKSWVRVRKKIFFHQLKVTISCVSMESGHERQPFRTEHHINPNTTAYLLHWNFSNVEFCECHPPGVFTLQICSDMPRIPLCHPIHLNRLLWHYLNILKCFMNLSSNFWTTLGLVCSNSHVVKYSIY